MIIICMFSGMIAATGLDVVIGEFVDRVTSSQTGEKERDDDLRHRVHHFRPGIHRSAEQLCALAFLPVLRSIARKNRISPVQIGAVCDFPPPPWAEP